MPSRKLSTMIAVLLALCVILAGCGGVTLNAKYSELLDQTAALSQETASRAAAGNLTPAQMAQALNGQAKTWQMFRDARDGKASPTAPAAAPPTPATQPTP